VDKVPKNAPVSCQVNISSHVPARDEKFLFPYNLNKSEYLLVDSLNTNPWPLTTGNNIKIIDSLLNSNTWRAVYREGGFILLNKIF
jgi:hypothetical protein